MFDIGELRHIHLELSSFCNARCSRCPRTFYGYPYPKGYRECNLSLARLQELLSDDVVSRLNEILVNGNFGDFVMNHDSLDILSWFRQKNQDLDIKICTNGGARDRKFWQQLAGVDPEVNFCIDGLRDTHAIYRQDTDYDTVIRNAGYFIKAGGRATWLMTEFDHNAHQFAEAEQLSLDLGFKSFRKRSTKRDTGPIYDRSGKKVFALKNIDYGYPDQVNDAYVDKILFQDRDVPYQASESRTISCESKNQRSIYISSEGHVTPCCYTGLYPVNRSFYSGLPDLLKINSLEESFKLFKSIEKSLVDGPQLNVCQYFCQK